MSVVALGTYGTEPQNTVDNKYDNEQADDIVAPFLWACVGIRASGKSYTVSTYLRWSQTVKKGVRSRPLYDEVFIISPSYKSNRDYWSDVIKEENWVLPEMCCVEHVIEKCEEEARKWDDYQRELKAYHEIVRKMQSNTELSEDELMVAMAQGLLNAEDWLAKRVPPPPVWERHVENEEDRPAQMCLVIDDCLGQNALLNSTGLMRLACLNRHVAPFEEPWTSKRTGKTRSAIGLSLVYLTQTYRCQGPGPSRTLRENLTCASVWRNRQPKMLQSIVEELGSIVGQRRFALAYNEAVKEPHGCVTVEFKPNNPDLQFRRGLKEAIIVPETSADETKAVAATSASGVMR